MAASLLSTIPHINSETHPPPPIINVVCKYLRQFLGTSFRVATFPARGQLTSLYVTHYVNAKTCHNKSKVCLLQFFFLFC